MRVPKINIARMGFWLTAAAACVVTLLAAANAFGRRDWATGLPGLDAGPKDPNGPAKRVASGPGSPPDPRAQRIDKRSLFARQPSPRLTGVLGDQALFSDGQSVGVGEMYMERKVIEIGPDYVMLEKDGKPMKLSVVAGGEFPSADGGPPAGRMPATGRGGPASSPASNPASGPASGPASSPASGPGAGAGGGPGALSATRPPDIRRPSPGN